MIKRTTAFAALLIAVLMCMSALGCSLVTVNEEKDMARIAAKVGDIEITKQEFSALYDQYLPYASWMGLDVSTDSGREAFVAMVIDELLYGKVLAYKAREQGYFNFSEEQLAQIEADIAENVAYYVDEARAIAEDEFAEDPDIDVEARTKELLKEITLSYTGEEYDEAGLTEYVREYIEESYAAEAMMDAVYAQVSITEDEVRAAYDEQMAAIKAELAEDPGYYRTLQEDAELYGDTLPALYAPGGYIRVRVISVAPEDEVNPEYAANMLDINDLTLELGNLTLAEQDDETTARIEEIKATVKQLEEESKAILDEYLASSRTKIEEAYAKLESGSDFTEIMLEYGTDAYFSDNEIFRQRGRLMSEHISEQDWPESVKAAAMKLTAPNSYTEIIEANEDDTYGFYVVQFVGNEPSGERAYSDVRDLVEKEALAAKQSDEWNALVDEWMADQSLIQRFDDVIKTIGA